MTLHYDGLYAKAWLVEDHAWFIDAPGQSPAWRCYTAQVIDLNEVVAGSDPYREFPEARWEIAVYALDPELDPTPGDYDTWGPMLPQNIRVHIGGDVPRDAVIKALDSYCKSVTEGHVLAEPMFPWGDGTGTEATAIRDAILSTVEHHHHGHT